MEHDLINYLRHERDIKLKRCDWTQSPDSPLTDAKNSTTTHADAVEAVKTKWPKDNSGPVE